MKYYLRNNLKAYWILSLNGLPHWSKAWFDKPIEFDTIEAAKSKGQELGGNFQIVNERFEIVWPVKTEQ